MRVRAGLRRLGLPTKLIRCSKIGYRTARLILCGSGLDAVYSESDSRGHSEAKGRFF
jgi:hypothetical protein